MFHRQRRGFSLFELVFSSALGLLIFGAIVLSITSSAYSQSRAELLFAADVLLTSRAEAASLLPYDDLAGLIGQEVVKQNGYSFVLHTTIEELSALSPGGVRKMSFRLTWKDRVSEGSRERCLLRSAPW